MTTISQEIQFRQRFCLASGCGAMFFVCPHCDRGQGYCSDNCRQRSRLKQVRAASRRYQKSPEGRLGHRDCQGSYRQRKAVAALVLPAKNVTHHGSEEESRSAILSILSRKKSLTLSPERLRRSLSETGSLICQFCERTALFLNPFHGFTQPSILYRQYSTFRHEIQRDGFWVLVIYQGETPQ